MKSKVYATPKAFKQALEQRLRASAGLAVGRNRQILVFDRFLARISERFNEAAILKGGLALELRLDHARATKDVDLRMIGDPEQVLIAMQDAGRLNLGDFMSFEVLPDATHPIIQSPGAQYGGLRFWAECQLADKIYGERFGVDVAFGDPLVGELEVLEAADVLAFAGIPPPKLRVYPVETHIAEKLHAYTLRPPGENSRVKDLPDLALLAGIRPLGARLLYQAISRTFEHRETHALPAQVPAPSEHWSIPYEKLAKKEQLKWQTLEVLTRDVQRFLDPVLSGSLDAVWSPELWLWGAPPTSP